MTGSPSSDLPEYEVYALRYATVARRRNQNFMQADPHDGPMPMDYFVWLIRGADRCCLVDTGFNRQASELRQREFLRCPITGLAALDIAPDQVSDVILTHLHYDHAGNVNLLPRARIHLQEAELQYAVSRHMQFHLLRHAYAVDDVTHIVEGLYGDRVVFYQGDATYAPGIELLHVGGHTQGLQAVRVHTARGWIVLASDASHYYDNVCNESPFPIVHDVGAMLTGYRRLLGLCDSADHFVPGHDPLVMQRYPAHGDPADGIVALHVSPREGAAAL